MTIPPSTGRRKTRFVRDEPPPDDLLVFVRAAGSSVDGAIADMVRDARYSRDTYAIEHPDGARVILFGVSVFALTAGRPVSDVLERFLASPNYLSVTVGSLRAAGFEVISTGINPALRCPTDWRRRRQPAVVRHNRRGSPRARRGACGSRRAAATQPRLRWWRRSVGGTMTTGTRSPWHVERLDQAIVDRLAARYTLDPLGVDLVADPP